MIKLFDLQHQAAKCLIALGGTLLASAVHAQAAIKSVSASLQGGVEVVRVEFSQPLTAVPSGFVIQSPARIAFDFPNVTTTLGRAPIDLNTGNVRSANVIQAGERSRLVLNLKESSGYEAKIDGEMLLVILEKTIGKSFQAASSLEPVDDDVASLTDIDFRRGTDNVGRVVVDISSSQVGVDIRQQGKNLFVEFLKTRLPEGLRRRLDVTDFGTPVETVVATQIGDKVRMAVNARGDWEHSAYQTDKQFVLEIREQKNDPSKLTQGKGFNGEKLSLNFQNVEVRSLLQVIADFTNFNVVTSDSVTGTLTLRLKDVPWDQALEIILQAKGLAMRKAGNVIWIAPGDEIASREKAELESKASIESLESLRTQGFQMNYAKAVDIAAQLNASQSAAAAIPGGAGSANNGRMLSPRGSVLAEPRTNQLFVTDIPSRLEQIQQFIAKLDIPIRQVLIEARIVEADDKFGKSLGVRLGGSDLRGVRGGDPGYSVGGGNRVAIGGSYNAVASTTGEAENTLDTLNTSFVNLPALGLGGVSPASFAVSLFSASANRFLNLEISALEADSRGKIVSSPRVVTADQVKAVIEQGVEYPYQTTAPNGGTTISFKKAGLKLEVTPQITPEGNIILDVEVNKDSPGEVLSGARAINTKRVQTQVLVENGGTVVIGGIFESVESDGETKVPFFGDIPVMGNLFKTRNKTANKSEMLVFITPKVVSDRQSSR
jgi:type IV pilus assembly protein PilQ